MPIFKSMEKYKKYFKKEQNSLIKIICHKSQSTGMPWQKKASYLNIGQRWDICKRVIYIHFLPIQSVSKDYNLVKK